jgi:hypothetical protein
MYIARLTTRLAKSLAELEMPLSWRVASGINQTAVREC